MAPGVGRDLPAMVAVAVVVLAGAALLAPSSGSLAAPRPVPAAPPQHIHRQAPSGGPAVTVVPDLLGRSAVAARAALRRARFRVRVVAGLERSLAPDLVLAERPAPGTLVAPEVTIELVVNRFRIPGSAPS